MADTDEEMKTVAIRAPENAVPGGKVKINHQGHQVIVTYPSDVLPGQEIKVQVPKNPPKVPQQLPPLETTPARPAVADAAAPESGGAIHMKLMQEKEREAAEEERYTDQAEHIESINTVAAWLLMPAVQRPAQSIKFGGKALKGGWLGRVDTAKYLFLGIFFTFLQCFVVTAMISDVTLQNAVGEYGDGMMEKIAEAATSQDTVPGMWLSKYGMPPRGVKYCKDEANWNKIMTEMVAAGFQPEEAAMIANVYEGPYATCVQPFQAWGTSDPATPYQNAEPFFISELFTAVMMLAFFFVETYDEEGELFLQGLLVFSAPRQSSETYADGTAYIPSVSFWTKSLLLDVFLGLRFYFVRIYAFNLVAAVALASGQLIVANPGIIDCVLNGIALLFIVEFDEKVFKLMVPKTHQNKLRKEVIKAKNIANVFRKSQKSTEIFSIFAVIFATTAAFGTRLLPESQSELDFYATFIPGTAWLRINFLTGLLSVIGWMCHARGVYKMTSGAHSRAERKVLTNLIVQHNKWGDDPAPDAVEVLRAELENLPVQDLKARAKQLMGHEWDQVDDDDSEMVKKNLGKGSGVAATSTVILMQVRSLVATLSSSMLFVNLCELCAHQEYTAHSSQPVGMSVSKNALILSIVMFFAGFVISMTLMDCFQPAADGRSKNHCWQCRKKGTNVLTEGTPEYEAFMNKRAESAREAHANRGQSAHFAIHDSDEDGSDDVGELNKLLR